MSDNTEANKRIAKNTMLLYVRMGVMMIISFFTARITLEALGVVDYGINNVVGGLVSMFSLISSSLSSSVSRFMTFGLGKGDKKKLNTIFSTSVNIHIILAIVVVIAIETVGVWFLNNKMVIPIERLAAAHWVLQCSTLLFAVGLLSVPYNAAIIAHERMDVYAYFTLFDAFARLAIIFAIKYYGGDKLILLAIISLIPTLIKQFYYWHYSKTHFEECTYRFAWNKRVFKEISGFAGWNFIGCTAGLTKDQGVNIAINMFTGPAINAARGIAMQINGIISQFIGNFMVAINPQITKEYAAGNLQRMHSLIFKSTRFSYYLFLILSIPILLEVETILYIWLGQVPEHTVLFTRLVIILSLAEIISNALITAQNATGKIRNYQLVVGGILLMNFPISYILLKIGYIPEITVIVAIIISQVCLMARLSFLRHSVKLDITSFLKNVYCNAIMVSIAAAILPYICHLFIEGRLARLFTVGIVSIVTSGLSIYFIGCDKEERALTKRYVGKFKRKIFRNKNGQVTALARQSNIELLRMLAMFLVLLVHADFFSLGAPSINEIQHKPLDASLRLFFESISIFCVNVFVLISGWFGIKPSFKGLCNFIYQCLFFLIGLYLITILAGVNNISIQGIAGCFFATKLNWFIKAYLLLYLLSPVLNAFVKTTTKKTFKLVLISFFIFTCTYGWIGAASFMDNGYTTLFFIGLYLLARYIRLYTPKWSQHTPWVYLAIYLLCATLVTAASFLIPYLFDRYIPVDLYSYICPTTIIGALCLLLCFTKIKLQNQFINWCGISCFAVFLMHVSPSTLWHFKALFIYLHSHCSVAIFWLITFAVLSLIFIVAILIDKIRIITFNHLYAKTLSRWETRFNNYR